MDQLLTSILKDWGWVGVAVYLSGKYGWIVCKKYWSDSYVSYSDLKVRIESAERINSLSMQKANELERVMADTVSRLGQHLEREKLEDIEFALMKERYATLKEIMAENQRKLENHLNEIWKAVDEMRRTMRNERS